MFSGVPSSRKTYNFTTPPSSCSTTVYMVPLKTFASIRNFQLWSSELVSRRLLSVSKQDSWLQQLIFISVAAPVIINQSDHPALLHVRKGQRCLTQTSANLPGKKNWLLALNEHPGAVVNVLCKP